MRSVPVAILVSTAFLLAGCAGGDKHDDKTFTCPNGSVIELEAYADHENSTFNPASKCAKPTGGSSSKSNSTSAAPNVLPTLVLTITNSSGNVTPVTMLDGNLTFSAVGSSDADGSIAGIAVTVTDSNTTRTATLYDAAKKQFKNATFTFDRPGVVNVTVAMVDDRAGFSVNQTKVYVNHQQKVGGANIPATRPVVGTTACNGGDPLTSSSYYKEFSFVVSANASFIEATAITSGVSSPAGSTTSGASLTICSPQKVVLSNSGKSVITNEDAELPQPVGIESYYIGTYATSAQSTVTADVIVHYEPRPAA